MKENEFKGFDGCTGVSAGFLRRASLSLALIGMLAVSAEAATVRALQGQVLVNSGQGYRLVDGSTILEPGATVVANPGSVAQVIYPGGCAVTVQPGSVYVVAAQSPCQNGGPLQQTGSVPQNPPAGITEGGGSGTGWALGIAAVAAGGAAVFLLTGAGSASP